MSDALSQTLRELHELFNRDHAALIKRCEELLADHPDFGPALMMMGLMAYFSNDQGLAINFLEKAHHTDPECKEYVDLLSTVLPRVGRVADSLYYAKLAIALEPNPVLARYIPKDLVNYRQALSEVAVSHHAAQAEMALRLGDFQTALQRGDEELRISPHDVATVIIVARALLGLGKSQAAVNSLRAGAYISPESPWVHGWLAEALIATGRHHQAVQHMRLALDMAPDDTRLLALCAGLSEWFDDANWVAAADIRARLADKIGEGRGVRTPDAIPETDMIGLIGDQFYDTPVTRFVLPVIRQFEKSVLYRLNQRRDPDTAAYKHAALRVRESAEVDVFTLGRTMVGDQVRALLALSPPSVESKFVPFKGAGGPAIIQWLSEPLVNRIVQADFVVGDAETRDIDEAEFGPARVITLDHMVAYAFPEVPLPVHTVGPLPRDRGKGMTFGVWSDLKRFTPSSIALWCRVLLSVQGSSLLVGGYSDWDDATLHWLHDQFSDYGMGERVRLYRPDSETETARLAFLADVDVMLDAVPVSSGADIAKSLWMGVPAVTLKGRRRAGRFGASVLSAAGFPEWIAPSEQEYVATALHLATAPDLAAVREGLRARVEASALCRPKELAEALRAGIEAAIKAGVPGR